MYKIRFAPAAIADLEEINRYISNDLFNPQAAAETTRLVFEKIRALASMPQTGSRLNTDIPILKTYRFLQCKHYLVFYRVEIKVVSIIRILYAKRDYLRLLNAGEDGDDNG